MTSRVTGGGEEKLTEAQRAAQDVLMCAGGSIYEAFDGLDLGFDRKTAMAYLAEPLRCAEKDGYPPGRLVGIALGFALTCVLADRAARRAQLPGPKGLKGDAM